MKEAEHAHKINSSRNRASVVGPLQNLRSGDMAYDMAMSTAIELMGRSGCDTV